MRETTSTTTTSTSRVSRLLHRLGGSVAAIGATPGERAARLDRSVPGRYRPQMTQRYWT